MGQYFAPIFVTLKKAIQDSAVQTEAARTWQYFVGQLSNETAQKHLNAIVVSLLPCLEIGHASASVHVVKTLESLIDTSTLLADISKAKSPVACLASIRAR